MLVLDNVIRYKTILAKDLLKNFLDDLYAQALKDKNLVRIIDLGMMKHEVDEGLDLRKDSLRAISNALDMGLELTNLEGFVKQQVRKNFRQEFNFPI